MSTERSGFPAGDLRVSDAERDRALAELTEAYEAGRITAEEVDQRSTAALSARTGSALIAPLGDLPVGRDPTSADVARPRRANGYLVSRLTIGGALTAICFGGVALNNAMHPGIERSAVVAPTVVAVLCFVLVIALRVRARRG